MNVSFPSKLIQLWALNRRKGKKISKHKISISRRKHRLFNREKNRIIDYRVVTCMESFYVFKHLENVEWDKNLIENNLAADFFFFFCHDFTKCKIFQSPFFSSFVFNTLKWKIDRPKNWIEANIYKSYIILLPVVFCCVCFFFGKIESIENIVDRWKIPNFHSILENGNFMLIAYLFPYAIVFISITYNHNNNNNNNRTADTCAFSVRYVPQWILMKRLWKNYKNRQ